MIMKLKCILFQILVQQVCIMDTTFNKSNKNTVNQLSKIKYVFKKMLLN